MPVQFEDLCARGRDLINRGLHATVVDADEEEVEGPLPMPEDEPDEEPIDPASPFFPHAEESDEEGEDDPPPPPPPRKVPPCRAS